MADPRSYVLGVDLGTTYSAAAIARGNVVEPCVLGTIAAQVPSVIVHREGAGILTGEAAERRAATEPLRSAREFKRRLGDPVPIIVAGTPYGAEALTAELLGAIVAQVSAREGSAPTTVVLTHPANYGEYKRGLLLEAARLAGLARDTVRLVSEPEAAAIAYARQQRIEPGEIIAVYDFGGGTFDAAIVRASPSGFELLGTPEGMERLGGIDFDQAVLAHVDSVLDGLVSAANQADPQVLAGQQRLRDDCRRAKESLSSDGDATIPVSLPGVQTQVRLTRDELEQMVRPRVEETVKALQRTIASAGLVPSQISRVLLVGGTSRMPVVADILRHTLGRPVSVDADPKLTIAIGAAMSAAPAISGVPRPPSPGSPVQSFAPPGPAGAPSTVAMTTAALASPATVTAPTGRKRVVTVAAALVGCAAAVVAVLVLRNGDDDQATSSASTTSVTSTVGAVQPSSGSSTSAPDGSTPATSTGTIDGTPITGEVSQLAFGGTVVGAGIPGEAVTAGPPGALTGIAIGASGDVHVSSATPTVVQVSGGQADVDATLTAAQAPAGGIAIGSDGSLFVTTPAGILHIVDGVTELLVNTPSTGLSPNLGPIVIDGGGNLYVADNGGARIFRRATDGALTVTAGTGTPIVPGATITDGGLATATALGVVTGLAVDRSGNLLIADATAHRVRMVLAADSTMHTVAGGGAIDPHALGGVGAPNGTAATGVAFASLDALAIDGQQRVYIADATNRSVLVVGPDGIAGLAIADVAATSLATSTAGAVVFSDGSSLWTITPVD